MCDQEYFMSKMARRLASKGFYAIQIDTRGHGDSSGDFKDITAERFCEDVSLAIKYIKDNLAETIFCVGRGVSATLLSLATGNDVKAIVGVNPLIFNLNSVKKILNPIVEGNQEISTLFKMVTSNNYVTEEEYSLLTALIDLGVIESNRSSRQLLRELLNMDLNIIYNNIKCDTLWLIDSCKNKDGFVEWSPSTPFPYILAMPEYTSLRMDPLWQHNVIERVVSWISELKLQ